MNILLCCHVLTAMYASYAYDITGFKPELPLS
jgi:hypothetical protein